MNEITAVSFKKNVSKLAMSLFVLMLVTQAGQVALMTLLSALAPDFMQQPYGMWVVSYAPLYLLAVPIYLIMASRIPDTKAKDNVKTERFGAGKFVGVLFVCFAAMYIFNMVSLLIVAGIGFIKGAPVQNPLMGMQANSGIIYNIFFGVILAPIGEEIMFRYIPYKKLGGYGDIAYIIISSLVFALFHANFSQMLYAFALGAIFAYITAKTGNIIRSIILHILVNAIGMLIAPLAATSTVGIIVLGLFVLTSILVGVIVLILTLVQRKLSFAKGELELPEHPAKAAVANVGFALYLALCAGLTLIVTLM